jgi:hypothetical protein
MMSCNSVCEPALDASQGPFVHGTNLTSVHGAAGGVARLSATHRTPRE